MPLSTKEACGGFPKVWKAVTRQIGFFSGVGLQGLHHGDWYGKGRLPKAKVAYQLPRLPKRSGALIDSEGGGFLDG